MVGLVKNSRSGCIFATGVAKSATGAKEPLIFDQTQTIHSPGYFHPRFLKIPERLTRDEDRT